MRCLDDLRIEPLLLFIDASEILIFSTHIREIDDNLKYSDPVFSFNYYFK